jgi:hypothetical protein
MAPRDGGARPWFVAGCAVVAVLCTAGNAAAEEAGVAATTEVTAMLLAREVAYEHGEGVPKDPQKALGLYCVAARAGNPEAQYSVGWMYANGRGVARDDAVAAAFFELAAQAGHAYAQRMLARVGAERGELPPCMRPPERPPATPPLEEPDPFTDLSPQRQKIAEMVTRVAPLYGIEPRLALAVIAVESNFEPRARSVRDARGLMQLIPGTAARFKVRNPFDAADNVRGGLAYLRWLLAYYQGRVTLAAAAYNAGEAAVDRYGGIPPYPETRDYVTRVLRLYPRDSHPFDARVAAPSPLLAAGGPRPL